MKITKLFGICAVALLIVSIACAGCTSAPKQTTQTPGVQPTPTHIPIAYNYPSNGFITDFGNGVLYFKSDTKEPAVFARELSIYLNKSPDYRIVAITGDNAIGYGYNNGYYVVVEPRNLTAH